MSWRYAVALLRHDAIDGSLKETNAIRQEILEKVKLRYPNGAAPERCRRARRWARMPVQGGGCYRRAGLPRPAAGHAGMRSPGVHGAVGLRDPPRWSRRVLTRVAFVYRNFRRMGI